MEQNPIIEVFLALGIIITAARIAGGIARYFDQPRVLGELLVGVILGPTVLNILHAPALGLDSAQLGETIHQFSELGVLFLMFKIGLDVHLSELLERGKIAGAAGVGGALVTVVLVLLTTLLFGYAGDTAIFAGVALAATSVSISAQVLLELGLLQTIEGRTLLPAALVDDVMALLLVSLAGVVATPTQAVDIGTFILILVRMIAYIGLAFALAWYVLPHLIHWIHTHPQWSHSYGVPATALVLALLFGWSAERFGGLAPITGAFIAGVGLSHMPEVIKRPIDEAMAHIAYAFLIPIFFVGIGLQVNLSQFPLSALPLAITLLLVAIAGKVVGVGLGSYRLGFNRRQAVRLGVCMIARGEVNLIIVSLGLARGLFQSNDPLFLSLFLVILLTTVLTPILVRLVFHKPAPPLAEGA